MQLSFTVNGTINAMFTPESGAPELKHIENMLVELWQKSPLEVVFLGSGLTDPGGNFNINFEVDDTSPILTGTTIEEVFMKVYYKNQLIIGDLDSSTGSFD